MAIDRWNPFQDMMNWREAMDRFFQDPFGQAAGRASMPMDVMETDSGYTVHASLPGFKPEEIQVQVSGNTLTIRGEHRDDNQGTPPAGTAQGQNGTSEQGGSQSGPQYLVRERRVQTVYRSITLPGAVNADAANAQFENGVLTLTLPRVAAAGSKQIPIGGAVSASTPQVSGGTATTGNDRGGALNPSTINPQVDPVDQASDESFPASDPPSSTVSTTPESPASS